MPDIIEQLEVGKKLQEGGIDVDSLRTKLNSVEEEAIEKSKLKKKKQPDVTKEDNIIEKSKDPFKQAEEIINDSLVPKENFKKIQRPEKYPGFDFTEQYQEGQKIFFIRAFEKLGFKELLELKIVSISPKTIIGCEGKKGTLCIGPDVQDRIFTDKKTAIKAYNKIRVRIYKDTESENEIEEMEEIVEEVITEEEE